MIALIYSFIDVTNYSSPASINDKTGKYRMISSHSKLFNVRRSTISIIRRVDIGINLNSSLLCLIFLIIPNYSQSVMFDICGPEGWLLLAGVCAVMGWWDAVSSSQVNWHHDTDSLVNSHWYACNELNKIVSSRARAFIHHIKV